MDINEVVSSVVLELRRGTLILLTLGCLRQRQYGYELVHALQEAGVSIEAGTLYPLLRRLEGQGLLQSVWQTDGAKPRKYYEMTDDGRAVLARVSQHWKTLQKCVDDVLTEVEHG